MHPLARTRLWDMHFGILPEHAFGPESPWYARGSCFRIRLFGRIAEHAVHAQVLEEGATPWSLKIFRMAPKQLKLFGVAEVDKDNHTRSTKSGQWLLCVNVSDDEEASAGTQTAAVGSFEVYDTKEHAVARRSALKDGTAPAAGAVGARPEGLVSDDMQNVKRHGLHNITSKWQDLCVEFEEGDGDADEDDEDDDPCIGKRIRMSFPFDFGSGKEMFMGEVTVKELDTFVSDRYVVEFAQGADARLFEHSVDKDLVSDLVEIQSALPSGAAVVVEFPSGGGEWLLELLKALPLSKALEEYSYEVDSSELFEFSAALDPVAFAGQTHSRMMTDAQMELVTKILTGARPKIEVHAIKRQSFPTSSAKRLGAAMKLALSRLSGSKPSLHVLSAELKKKAESDEDWTQFLRESFRITLPDKRHGWAATKDEYVWSGCLNAFLASGKEICDVNMIQSLPDSLQAGDLGLYLNEWAEKIEESVTAVNAKQQTSLGSSVMSALPPSINVTMHSPEAEAVTSEFEKSCDLQLRADAASVHMDSAAKALLKTICDLKEQGNVTAFKAVVDGVTDRRLLRLINCDRELRASLKSGLEDITVACTSIRNAIDRQLEQAVLNSKEVAVKARVSTAFRTARLCNLRRLKWFHLIDVDDNGTADRPLKALESMQREQATSLVTRVTNRMQSIVSSAHPSLLGEAMWFFPKLDEKTREYIELAVDWNSLNEWFATIVSLMAKPTSRFRVGDAGPPAAPLVLNVSWFDERSEFERKIERAVQFAIAKRDSPGGETKSGGGSLSDKKSRGGRNDRLMRQFEEVKAQLAAAMTHADGKGGKRLRMHGTLLGQRKRGRSYKDSNEDVDSDEEDPDDEASDDDGSQEDSSNEGSEASGEDESLEDSDEEEDDSDDSDDSWGSWDPEDNPATSHGYTSRREYQRDKSL